MSPSVSDHSPSRISGDLFSLLQTMRANTYGQIVRQRSSLFGFFYNNASYMLEKRDERHLRLIGFVGYVAYSVESGSLRRHKTLLAIEEVNVEAAQHALSMHYYVTPRQMICLACEGALEDKVEASNLSQVLAFVVQVLLCCAPLTARIATHAVSGENLRSL